MKALSGIPTIIIAAMLVLAGCTADDDTSVQIAEINGQGVGLANFYQYLEQVNPQLEYAKLPASEQERLLNEYASQRLFAARAEKQKLDKEKATQARLAFFRQRVLAEAYRQSLIDSIEVSDFEIETYYEENKPLFEIPAKYLIEHLVYREPESAIYAQGQLRDGRPYEDLAAQKASDTTLVFVERNQFSEEILLPKLRGPVAGLEVGETSEMIYTSYGYHVIRLAEKEDAALQPLEEVEDEIAARLRQMKSGQQLESIVNDSRTRGEIKLHLDSLRAEGAL
ncbi:MAG: hypothetical protein HKN59_05225 [Gammaproteobacteria bacterium]|nr:hypothetical protein [Gammaproteobacteria bacterium]